MPVFLNKLQIFYTILKLQKIRLFIIEINFCVCRTNVEISTFMYV